MSTRAAATSEGQVVEAMVDLTHRRVPGTDDETMGLVLALLRAAGRHRQTFESRAHADHGRHLRAFSVLYVVWLFGRPTARDIAHRLGMSRQTTSATLPGLEADGLVVRARDAAADRRLVIVELTQAGRDVVETEFRKQHELDVSWTRVLSAPERRELRNLLERLVPQATRRHSVRQLSKG